MKNLKNAKLPIILTATLLLTLTVLLTVLFTRKKKKGSAPEEQFDSNPIA